MAIQNRRGAYADFDPQKLVPGEWAVVQSGDPNSERGKAVYMAFEVGDVERMATYEDILENIDQATSDIQTQFTNELTQTITNANSAVSDMQDDIDAEIQSASSAVSALTTQVNTAIASANTATTNANTATNRANDAVDAIQAIIDRDDAVLSWNGRGGEVMPQSGDYTSAQITHGSSTVANMLTFDSTPTNGSQRAVQSGGVYSLIGNTTMGTDATTLTGAIAEHESEIVSINENVNNLNSLLSSKVGYVEFDSKADFKQKIVGGSASVMSANKPYIFMGDSNFSTAVLGSGNTGRMWGIVYCYSSATVHMLFMNSAHLHKCSYSASSDTFTDTLIS